MRLNSTSPINFKYNQEYHQQLHQNLANRKREKQLAQCLIEADKFTLSIEDKLIELEGKKKQKTEEFQDLADLLINLKGSVGYYMDACFGTQKYCETLVNDYEQEIHQQTNTQSMEWRLSIIETLKGWLPKKVENPQDTEQGRAEAELNITEENKNDYIKKTVDQIREAAIDDYLNDAATGLLTLYTMKPSSPKGFCDVMGLEQQKQEFQEEIINYVKNPEQQKIDEEEYGITAPRGFLFYGPPGCGKTFIAEALAAESGLDMYKMDVSKTGSKYVNQSSNNIQTAFDYLASKAKNSEKPILLFMDEVDSLAIKRDKVFGSSSEDIKVTTTLLKAIEKARDNGIIIIAATNKYDMLDDAFVARFDSQKYFGLPDEKQIAVLLKNALSKRSKGLALAQNEEEISKLSKELLGFSNRSIVFMVDSAAKLARRNSRSEITSQDILEIMKSSELQKVNENDYKKSANKTKKIGFA